MNAIQLKPGQVPAFVAVQNTHLDAKQTGTATLYSVKPASGTVFNIQLPNGLALEIDVVLARNCPVDKLNPQVVLL